MTLSPGTTLGPYQVTAKIGEGGMGEVWQARDTKLDRDVALKVLPEAFTSDPDRLARFEREAKVLASLNHPNIGHIYGLEEAEGQKALVLELVEGPTLAERIKQGPIPIDEALPIAKQIAEALEAAHEQGIIHRDLKPANVKVKDDGTVKVLDFGLAKAFQPDASDPNLSQSPTISLTAAATQMGMVIGTAAYMAPEQAKGKVVDKRADVWAFGAVLFEMLTGQKPFTGKDVSDTLAAVLRIDADYDALPDETPARLRQVLKACLQKEPKDRVRDIGDVSLAMDGTFDTPTQEPSSSAAPQLQVWQRPASLVLAAVALVAFTSVVWSVTGPTPSAPRVERFHLTPLAPETVFVAATGQDIAISPDGTKVVFRAGGALQVRAVEELTSLALIENPAFTPFVSPDSAWVGFNDIGDDTLKKVSIRGGPPVTIGSVGAPFARGASWGPNDTIIFGTSLPSGLWRISANGGEPEALTPDQDQDTANYVWPHILPGGRAVLFTILTGGAIENAQIAVLDLETNEQRVLVPGGSHPRYSSTGHIIYGASGALRAVGFNLDRLEVTNPNPVPVVDGVVTKASGAVDFDLAHDGSLVYIGGDDQVGGGRTPVWVDRQGREEPVGLPSRFYMMPRLSPDGTRLALGIVDPENTDVWLSELGRGTLSRLTTGPASDWSPLWTPDGERVVFASNRAGVWELFWKDPDGTEEPERLATIEEATELFPYAWSPDGEMLAFLYQNPGTRSDIGVLTLVGEPTWEPLLQTETDESTPTISPDGGWIAYDSDESGTYEVYVQRFPGLGDRRQISTGGGAHPLWSPDGLEIFYRAGDVLPQGSWTVV